MNTMRYDFRTVLKPHAIVATYQASADLHKTHSVATCFFASPHLFKQAADHYKAKATRSGVSIADELKGQLKGMKGLMREQIHEWHDEIENGYEKVLQIAIGICEQFKRQNFNEQQPGQAYDDLQQHFIQASHRGWIEQKHTIKMQKIIQRSFLAHQNSDHEALEHLREHFEKKLKKRARALPPTQGNTSVWYNVFQAQYDSSSNQARLKDVLLYGGTGARIPARSKEVITVLKMVKQSLNYANYLGISTQNILRNKSIDIAVEAEIENAYYDQNNSLMVFGKGKYLFKNLATTVPGNKSVGMHEFWHKIINATAGCYRRALTGISNKGESQALSEAMADIGSMMTQYYVLKTLYPDIVIQDPRVQCLYGIGTNLFVAGQPEDAVRHFKHNAYADDGKIAKMIGIDASAHYRNYHNWHDNEGKIHNQLALAGIVKGSATSLNGHEASLCFSGVFAKQLERVDIDPFDIHQYWLQGLRWSSFEANGPEMAERSIEAFKKNAGQYSEHYFNSFCNVWGESGIPLKYGGA